MVPRHAAQGAGRETALSKMNCKAPSDLRPREVVYVVGHPKFTGELCEVLDVRQETNGTHAVLRSLGRFRLERWGDPWQKRVWEEPSDARTKGLFWCRRGRR